MAYPSRAPARFRWGAGFRPRIRLIFPNSVHFDCPSSITELGSGVRFFCDFSKISTIFALFGMDILLVVGAEAPDCPRRGADGSAQIPNAHIPKCHRLLSSMSEPPFGSVIFKPQSKLQPLPSFKDPSTQLWGFFTNTGRSQNMCGKPPKLGIQDFGACGAAKFAVLKTCAPLLPFPL